MPSAGGEGVEAAEDVVAVAVVTTVEAEVAASKTPQLLLLKMPPSIKVPSTLIFRLESGGGAPCISGGVGGLISVQSQPHVRGKMSSLRNLQISEGLTNPAHK